MLKIYQKGEKMKITKFLLLAVIVALLLVVVFDAFLMPDAQAAGGVRCVGRGIRQTCFVPGVKHPVKCLNYGEVKLCYLQP
jgi:hypothetical protein